jgi:hypothetical protein
LASSLCKTNSIKKMGGKISKMMETDTKHRLKCDTLRKPQESKWSNSLTRNWSDRKILLRRCIILLPGH